MYSNGWLSAARTVRQTTNECAGGEDLESGAGRTRVPYGVDRYGGPLVVIHAFASTGSYR